MEKSDHISLPDISKTKLPMAYPSGKKQLPKSAVVLAADVGGTKTNLALFEVKNARLIALKRDQYPTKDHASFLTAVRSFHDLDDEPIHGACLGVAGAVTDNKALGTNFAWEIDGERLEKELNIKSVKLINDLEANAYGLSGLDDSDIETIIHGEKGNGNAAIISPGTGLGEAGLYWDGEAFHPYATEGGHCNYSPRNEMDVELWKFLMAKFGRVSWERLLSGRGIHNIYQFLRQYRDENEPEWLTSQFREEDPPIAISRAAKEKRDPVCVETLQLFVKYLSEESAQLALKTKAMSGIYIGGGIAPKILSLIDKKEFYKSFVNVGRMGNLLKTIPVKVVLNDKTALMGAAYYAAMGI